MSEAIPEGLKYKVIFNNDEISSGTYDAMLTINVYLNLGRYGGKLMTVYDPDTNTVYFYFIRFNEWV